ncbi:hypothetical protein EDB86DRAFT_2931869, partial [Lactarius hatsudake]
SILGPILSLFGLTLLQARLVLLATQLTVMPGDTFASNLNVPGANWYCNNLAGDEEILYQVLYVKTKRFVFHHKCT